MKDYYIILGLPKAASKNRIKQAYREKAKEHHPDKCDTNKNRRKFREVKEAYDTLSDDASRAAYDRALQKQRSGHGVSMHTSRKAAFSRRKRSGAPLRDVTTAPYARRFKNIHELRLQLILSPEEAYAGGRFPIAVPIPRLCPHCRHGGLLLQLLCPACNGEGHISSEKTVFLEVPPNIENGTRFQELVHEDEETKIYINAIILIAS